MAKDGKDQPEFFFPLLNLDVHNKKETRKNDFLGQEAQLAL